MKHISFTNNWDGGILDLHFILLTVYAFCEINLYNFDGYVFFYLMVISLCVIFSASVLSKYSTRCNQGARSYQVGILNHYEFSGL